MSTLIASHLGGVFPRDFPEMLWWSKSQWSKSDFTRLLVRYKHLHVICLILHKLGESKVEISAPNMGKELLSLNLLNKCLTCFRGQTICDLAFILCWPMFLVHSCCHFIVVVPYLCANQWQKQDKNGSIPLLH
jgi:hypothetical protein